MTKIEQITLLLQEAPEETLDRVLRVLTPDQPEPIVTQELVARRSLGKESMERTLTLTVNDEPKTYTVLITPEGAAFVGKVKEIPAISILSDSVTELMGDVEESILTSTKAK